MVQNTDRMEGKRDGKWNNIIRKSDGEAAMLFATGREKKCAMENESEEAIAVASYRCGVVLVSN